jgi:hypothetical protein
MSLMVERTQVNPHLDTMPTVAGDRHETNGRAHERPAGPPPAPGPGPAPSSPSADGRGPDGRFGGGNKFGQGNPHYRRLAQAHSAFLEAVGAEQVKELAAALYRRALAGDVEAAKVVLAYAIGRPLPAVDPDRAALHEFFLLVDGPSKAQVMRALLQDAPVEEATRLLQQVLDLQRPDVLKNLSDQAGKGSTSFAAQIKEESRAKTRRTSSRRT